MNDIKVKLTMKAIMLFETITGKSFYSIQADDMFDLLYAIVITNNPEYKITKDEFLNVLKNKKIASRLLKELNEEMEFIEFLSPKSVTDNSGSSNSPAEETTVTEIIGSFITLYGLDINYVMNQMQLWEIVPIAKSIESTEKVHMTEKRFWSYLNMLPHIDGKKIRSPEQLLPFEWEKKDKKIDTEKFFKDNEDKISAFFKSQENNE